MQLSMDSSNRTQDFYKRSVIGFSNSTKFSVVLTQKLKKRIKQRYSNTPRLSCLLHCAALAVCIQKSGIDFSGGIKICPDGFNPRHLKYYLKNFLGDSYNDSIVFESVGNQDPAHKHANHIRKNINEADIILKEKDLTEYFMSRSEPHEGGS